MGCRAGGFSLFQKRKTHKHTIKII
uniref:Uncharacterized protein n=1 Tax=Rhizophora mucronata TaxID=61149 RepID=A0A2P2Q5R1_RHIMU